jgi:hypothetical protein
VVHISSGLDSGFESVSPGSDVFFSGSFGSTKTWWVGLDNARNTDYGELGQVTTFAACAPSDSTVSARAEGAAQERVTQAVAAQAARQRQVSIGRKPTVLVSARGAG